ncbi:MAG: hypothetical protein NWE93_00130 [Candidatus Bathyarchaeota archaeon]|nr:hypothetical protein [Candidatus Bathyarchaeota archaeon]
MTKQINDDLKCGLSIDDVKVEVQPACIPDSLVIAAPSIVVKPKSSKVKARMVKAKVVTKKSSLEKATSHLYDLEDSHGPEKCLNIDFGLYQMEDY